jgi:hypothetical protein
MLEIRVTLFVFKKSTKNKFETIKDNISSFSFSDNETKAAMLEIYTHHN